MRTAAPPPGDQHWEPGGQPVPRRSVPRWSRILSGSAKIPAPTGFRRPAGGDAGALYKGRHRAESRFLHQTSFLDCGYARRVRARPASRDRAEPDPGALGLPVVGRGWETALVERSILGSLWRRPPAFCAGVSPARPQAAEGRRSGQGFLMGIGDIADSMARQVDDAFVTDGDFSSLATPAPPLSSLGRGRASTMRRAAMITPPCSGAASPGSCKCCPL